jgi:DNA invertase Pin-like site-specific DNA recombinase
VKTYDTLIRVSKMNGRKESAESTMTTDDQAAATARAIKEAGGRRGKTFEALDQSGFTIHENGVYAAILERVRAGKSHGVAVAYGDRLTRNWRAVGAFYDALEKAGAEVLIAGMPGVDYRTMQGRTMTGLMAVMADAGYMTAKARGDAIADLTIKRGVPNRVPYGYRRNADHIGAKVDPERDAKALVPEPSTAPVVQRIFALRLDGHRLAAIVDTLDAAGVPSPRGGKWTHSTLETILRNETYTGSVILGKRRVEGAHEALVSRVEWRRAQETDWTVTHHGAYKTGIAGGLMRCAGCERPLAVAGPPDRLTYSCRRRQTTKGRCPRPMHVSKAVADAYVDGVIRNALRNEGVGLVASARELEEARLARDRAVQERKGWVKFKSVVEDEDWAEGYRQRKEAAAQAEHVYDELLARASEVADLPQDEAAYDALDFAGQRRVARSMIERIRVLPPLSRSRLAPIEDRFDLDWKRPGQVTGAGR